VTGPWTGRTDVILGVLLAAYIPRFAQSVPLQVVFASQRIGGLTVAMLAASIVKIALAVTLGSAYGLVGIAASAIVPMVITSLFVVPRLVLLISGLTGLQYLRCFERAAV